MGRGTGGLFLTRARALVGGGGDAAVIAIALLGVWIFWSRFSELSTLSWWYDRVAPGQAHAERPQPDYDVTTLPWRSAQPRAFEIKDGRLAIVTNAESFGYQLYASVDTHGARAADIEFEIDVESGGASIGLLQDGKWITSNSSALTGRFADTNSALLGYRRSIMLVIANNNPAGESRLNVKLLRLYLRK